MAVKTNAIITVNNRKSIVNKDLWCYEDDKNIDIYFMIEDERYEVISEEQSLKYYSFTIIKPNGLQIDRNELIPIETNHIKLKIDGVSDFDEVGKYIIQIHLYDTDDINTRSEFKIPEVNFEIVSRAKGKDAVLLNENSINLLTENESPINYNGNLGIKISEMPELNNYTGNGYTPLNYEGTTYRVSIDKVLNKTVKSNVDEIKKYVDNSINNSGSLTSEQIKEVNDLRNIGSKINSFKNLSDTPKVGYISIIDDDGDASFLTKLKPVFDEFNIKIDIAVNAGAIGNEDNKMSWEQLKQLKQEGYGILNHGYMHQSPKNLTIEQLKQNYEREKNEFILNGIDTYDYYVYAGADGQTENSVKNKLKQFYKCSFANSNSPNSLIPFENYEIRRQPIYGTEIVVKNYIDLCMEKYGYCVLFGHSYDAGYTQESLRIILSYIKEKGYFVTHAKDVIDKFTNIIELRNDNGFTFVDINGNMRNDQLDQLNVRIINEPFDFNQSIFDYPNNCVSIFYKLGKSTYTENLFKMGCIVTTYNFDDKRFSHQILKSITDSKIYVRKWSTTNNNWNTIEELNPQTVKVDTSIPVNSNIANFPLGTEIISYIDYSTALSVGLPDVGIIKTYRICPNEIYSYQEYKRAGRYEIYMRNWDTTNNCWKPFVKVGQQIT